jgi:hypothetical protein
MPRPLLWPRPETIRRASLSQTKALQVIAPEKFEKLFEKSQRD